MRRLPGESLLQARRGGGLAVKDEGAYLIVARLGEAREIKVGSLGRMNFREGFYVYVGSAMAGIEARVSRHLRRDKNVFWHIDYLLERAEVVGVLRFTSSKRVECELSRRVSELADGCIKKFGSSDCGCKSHLYFFKENPLKYDRLNKLSLE